MFLPPIPMTTGPAKLMLFSLKLEPPAWVSIVPGTFKTFSIVWLVRSNIAWKSCWSVRKPARKTREKNIILLFFFHIKWFTVLRDTDLGYTDLVRNFNLVEILKTLQWPIFRLNRHSTVLRSRPCTWWNYKFQIINFLKPQSAFFSLSIKCNFFSSICRKSIFIYAPETRNASFCQQSKTKAELWNEIWRCQLF